MHGQTDNEAACAVRERLLHDRVPDEVLASALGIGLRQLYYYAAQGLPYIRIAGRRYFHIAEATDWMCNHKGRIKPEPAPLPAPRSVGRPRREAGSPSNGRVGTHTAPGFRTLRPGPEAGRREAAANGENGCGESAEGAAGPLVRRPLPVTRRLAVKIVVAANRHHQSQVQEMLDRHAKPRLRRRALPRRPLNQGS